MMFAASSAGAVAALVNNKGNITYVSDQRWDGWIYWVAMPLMATYIITLIVLSIKYRTKKPK
jgi:hypothetical protein